MLRKEEVRIADTNTDCTLAEGVMQLRKSHMGGGPEGRGELPLITTGHKAPLNDDSAELGDFSSSQILQNLWALTG